MTTKGFGTSCEERLLRNCPYNLGSGQKPFNTRNCVSVHLGASPGPDGLGHFALSSACSHRPFLSVFLCITFHSRPSSCLLAHPQGKQDSHWFPNTPGRVAFHTNPSISMLQTPRTRPTASASRSPTLLFCVPWACDLQALPSTVNFPHKEQGS